MNFRENVMKYSNHNIDDNKDKIKSRIYKYGIQAGLSDMIKLLEAHKPDSFGRFWRNLDWR